MAATKTETGDFIIIVDRDGQVMIRRKGGADLAFFAFPARLLPSFVAAIRRAAGDKKDHS